MTSFIQRVLSPGSTAAQSQKTFLVHWAISRELKDMHVPEDVEAVLVLHACSVFMLLTLPAACVALIR